MGQEVGGAGSGWGRKWVGQEVGVAGGGREGAALPHFVRTVKNIPRVQASQPPLLSMDSK